MQVTWHFYIGMLAFLNGEDKKVITVVLACPAYQDAVNDSELRSDLQADEELSWALAHCPLDSKRNQE